MQSMHAFGLKVSGMCVVMGWVGEAMQSRITYTQARFRGMRGRKLAFECGKKVWQKFIDDETGRTYWYNSATGKALWKKPRYIYI